ncbi:hypothetical protein FSP39_019038 [Pinctada imbricata]|uniref:CARD domain-containing protein n=1 Tax=Pinctada imbricata TaxID=66713 RepID=A0AA89BRI1_PINIB|nr:hypothetical protein FSP39_019038 [Pinctada imbricata]
MDFRHRQVLKRHHMDIVQDLAVNEDFLGRCYQEELFDSDHIEIIKAERIGRQQAHKVLELLPRRGPDAFHVFINILQHQYDWLAKTLTDSLDKNRMDTDDIQEKLMCSLKPEYEPVTQSPRLSTQRSTEEDTVNSVDQQVKETVEQFYHKSFGLNRKLSVIDKKAIEKFLHDQIILDRQKQQKILMEDVTDAKAKPDSGNTPVVIKQWLLNVHHRLRQDLNQNTVNDSDSHDLKSISFEVVENQINSNLRRVNLLEEQLLNVYDLFPEKVRRKSPRALVEAVISKYHEIEAELERQKNDIDKMSQEQFELTMEKKKILHESQRRDIDMEVKNKQLQTQRDEIRSLRIEIDRLQRINQQHAEKEKTLSELQHMVDELKESRDLIKDENLSLKQKLECGKTSPRQTPRRSYSINKGSKVKGPSSKKRSYINQDHVDVLSTLNMSVFLRPPVKFKPIHVGRSHFFQSVLLSNNHDKRHFTSCHHPPFHKLPMRLPETHMDPREKATLQNCRNCFVEDLDPSISFLSALFCAGVITEDQKDRIHKQVTRQDKVITLLDILPRRGPRAFKKFVGILKQDYAWISERLEAEYQVQDYMKKIDNALEERRKKNGECIRDKEYVNRIIVETVIPIMMEEIGRPSTSNPSGVGFDQPIRDIINDHMIPITGGKDAQKMNLDFYHGGILLDKLVDLIENLKENSLKSLGLLDLTEFHSPLPKLIDFKLQELRDEISSMKKESRKSKKGEDKTMAENQKLKNDCSALRTELKKARAEYNSAKVDIKKLKDQLQKSRYENEKLKQEVQSLKDHMKKAGIDISISSDFT